MTILKILQIIITYTSIKMKFNQKALKQIKKEIYGRIASGKNIKKSNQLTSKKSRRW